MHTFNVYQLYINGEPVGDKTNRLKYLFDDIADILKNLKKGDEILVKVDEETVDE